MKKIISGLMIVLFFSFQLGLLVFAESVDNPFIDVPEDAYYYESVISLYTKGLMIGVEDKVFSPYEAMTRGMLVLTLVRLNSDYSYLVEENVEPLEKFKSDGFTDLPETSWYYDAVIWAAENNIVEGYPDGTFKGDAKVTRAEAVAIICRYMEHFDIELQVPSGVSIAIPTTVFSDYGDIPEWSREYVDKLFNYQIVIGSSTGNGSIWFYPNYSIRRADMACIIDRLLSNN